MPSRKDTPKRVERSTERSSAQIDYPYIRAWCHMMGSKPYYLEDELVRARADQAPANAVYSSNDVGGSGPRRWITTDDITRSDTRHAIGLPPLTEEAR